MNQSILMKKERWVSVAVGFYLFIFLFERCFTVGKIPYRFETGVAYPAIFILSGYLMQGDKDWEHMGKRTLHEFLILFVPSYISLFLIRLYQYAMLNWGSVDYWWKYVREAGYTMYYSSARDLGGITKFGPAWMLVVLFLSRQIVNAISVIAHKLFGGQVRNRSNKVSKEESFLWIICAVIGIAGLVLMKQYILLPINLNTAMLATFLIALGMIWRRFAGNIPERRLIVVMVVTGVAAIAGLATNRYMDIVGLSYPGITGGLVLSLCAVFFFTNLLKYCVYIPVLAQFFRLLSKHFILLTLVFEVSEIYSILWSSVYEIWTALVQAIIVLALTELILQMGNVIFPKSRWGKADRTFALHYSKAAHVVFYMATELIFVSMSLPYTAIDGLVSTNKQTAITLFATAVLLLTYALLIPSYPNRWMPIMMTSIIGLTLFRAIHNHDVNAQYCFYIFIAAAIGSDLYLIGKITWIAGLAVILTVYYLSMNGYIPYELNGSVGSSLSGHRFGFINKNVTSGYILSNMLAYCMSRKSKNRMWLIVDIAFIGFGAFVNYRYVGGRAELVLMVLLLVGTVIYRLIGEEPLRFRGFHTVVKWLHYILGVPIYIVILIASVILSWTYNGTHAAFENIIGKVTDPSTYTIRLWLNKTALMVYKPKLWGQYIYQTTEDEGYFFIDSSYIKLLLQDGIILMAIFLTIATMVQLINLKRENYYLVFLGTITALSGIMESQMLSSAFSVILLSLFCINGYDINIGNNILQVRVDNLPNSPRYFND